MRELNLQQAAEILRDGGIVAYPTESVYGLGCDPANTAAVERILKLKRRPQQKGLICIAASIEQLEPWLDLRRSDEVERAKATWPGAVTWVLKAKSAAPSPICREDGTIAVRITDHPVAKALCEVFGGPVVSTSANPAGASPARGRGALSYYFHDRIDGVLVGTLGKRSRPSEIRDGTTGETLRPS